MLTSASIDRAVQTFPSLRKRVGRLFSSVSFSRDPRQTQLDLGFEFDAISKMPTANLLGFVDFMASAMPGGNLYLFGGVLRDLALFGRRGFHSDVDIVVEGSWGWLESYLEGVGAVRNKFGGYRLFVGDWPIDVWNAEDTWAIRRGLVSYAGIASLTKTTVLNWDAVLMNWRTGSFVCDANYLTTLRDRALDIVLEDNPNPIGMAVRVLRHLSSKDARRVGLRAITYLERVTSEFSYVELKNSEVASYGSSLIEPAIYQLFAVSREMERRCPDQRFADAVSELSRRGVAVAGRQFPLIVERPA